jgi:hypothetical protein
MSNIKVSFVSHQRKAKVAPNPQYPDGIDIDLRNGAKQGCETPLPYPAQCCGILLVRCSTCGASAAITTAGRADDPRSVKLACKTWQ